MNIKTNLKTLGVVLALLVIVATAFAIGRTTAPPASVTLAWDKSPGTNVIVNYKVYYGPASGTYTNAVSAGTNLTVAVSNLVRGATYYFAATAIDNAALESDYSNEVFARTRIPPASPPNLSVTGNN